MTYDIYKNSVQVQIVNYFMKIGILKKGEILIDAVEYLWPLLMNIDQVGIGFQQDNTTLYFANDTIRMLTLVKF